MASLVLLQPGELLSEQELRSPVGGNLGHQLLLQIKALRVIAAAVRERRLDQQTFRLRQSPGLRRRLLQALQAFGAGRDVAQVGSSQDEIGIEGERLRELGRGL